MMRKDLKYSESQALDLFLPSRMDPVPPLLIFIHGGAWVSRSKKEFEHIGETWSRAGVAVAVIDYRLSPEAISTTIHPAHTKDCAEAVAWLFSHSQEFGYDSKRIFLVGHSAGAFMSAVLAFDAHFLRAHKLEPSFLRGFIGLNAIYDIPLLQQNYPKYREWFLQFAFGKDESFWAASSPVNFPVETLRKEKSFCASPWLLVQSPDDELLDEAQADAFQKFLDTLQVPYETSRERTGKHYDALQRIGKDGDTLTPLMLGFVKRNSSHYC